MFLLANQQPASSAASTPLISFMLFIRYGFAMTHPMPYDQYRWLSSSEYQELQKRIEEGGEDEFMGEDQESYILEVDLEYSENLSSSHNSCPMAANVKDIDYSDLSPFSKQVLEELTGKTKHSTRKLTATMEPKEKYLVHVLNLQFYLKHGLKLKKIHRVIGFRQRSFLKDYIHKCTDMRKKSRTKAEAAVWKLCVNS